MFPVNIINNGLANYFIRDSNPCVARLFFTFKTILKTNEMTPKTINGLCKIV